MPSKRARSAGVIDIQTADQFTQIGSNPLYPDDGRYAQAGDLDFSGFPGPYLLPATFKGVYDGGGHAITNLGATLFQRVGDLGTPYGANPPTVKNLTVSAAPGFTVTANADFALLAGAADGALFDHVTITGAITVGTQNHDNTPGVLTAIQCRFQDCVNRASVLDDFACGVGVGCYSRNAGGLVNQAYDCMFLRCANHGSLQGVESLCGIACQADACRFLSCENRGTLTHTRANAYPGTHAGNCGGIAGRTTDSDFLDCVNRGAMLTNTADVVGGVVAMDVCSAPISIMNCRNEAPIEANGGIFGLVNTNADLLVTGNLNTGLINKTSTVDGEPGAGIGGLAQLTPGDGVRQWVNGNRNCADIDTTGIYGAGILGMLWVEAAYGLTSADVRFRDNVVGCGHVRSVRNAFRVVANVKDPDHRIAFDNYANPTVTVKGDDTFSTESDYTVDTVVTPAFPRYGADDLHGADLTERPCDGAYDGEGYCRSARCRENAHHQNA